MTVNNLNLSENLKTGLALQCLQSSINELTQPTPKLSQEDPSALWIKTIQKAVKAFSTLEEAFKSAEIKEDHEAVNLIVMGLNDCSLKLQKLCNNSNLNSVPNESRDSQLIQNVRNQFIQTFESRYHQIDQRSSFEARSSNLIALHQNIQSLKQLATPEKKSQFLKTFRSLSIFDQKAFIESFISLGLSEGAIIGYLKTKHAKLFADIESITNLELKNKLGAQILDTLKKETKLTENELFSIALNQMTELPDQLTNSFERFLLNKVGILKHDGLTQLHKTLREIAKSQDKIHIEDWDKDWSQYHLKSDEKNSPWVSRLVRGLSFVDLEQRSLELQSLYKEFDQKYGHEVTTYLFKHCPLIDQVRNGSFHGFTNEMKQDLSERAAFISKMRACKSELLKRYPLLQTINDNSSNLFQMWKGLELGIVLCPAIFESKNDIINRGKIVSELFLSLNSLINEKMDEKSAEFLLVLILKKFSLNARHDQIQGQADLFEIKRNGLNQATRNDFQSSNESRCKSIYTVRNENGKTIGKYKPNNIGVAAREVKGYAYDSILALGMTPPTGFARLSMRNSLLSLKDSFQRADDKFTLAKNLELSGEIQLAKLYRAEALELKKSAMEQSTRFPDEVKQALYGCLSSRFAHENFSIGEGLWWNDDLNIVSLGLRIQTIEDVLKSEAFQKFKMKNSFETKDEQGSIQRWINEPLQRVIELLTQDPNAGEKLRDIPKAHVQMYCILGLVKGAMDGFSGNALVTFSENGSVKQIHEFDDERSMPPGNEWYQFRMWQFGMPQANLPFDRTTMLLFSNPELLKQFQTYNRSDKSNMISSQSYDIQEKRIEKMIQLFQMELKKSVPTLTPRELFFEVFGGKDNFRYWNEQKFLNPWHVFEYCTGDVGRGAYFTDNQDEQESLNAKFKTLYEIPESQAKDLLSAIKIEHPKTCLVVKRDAGFGNSLFIRGYIPGVIDWENGVLLKCINSDTWILEADNEWALGEYKIYLNNESEEMTSSNHVLEANCKSRIVTPLF